MNKVSVIVPVYNVEKYLEECLDSIINQTYQNLEIILIDDGSTDKSPEICDRYAGIDDRIKVIHKENEGPGEARNIGLDVMTGDYIATVDSDDIVCPNMFEVLVYTSINADADIVECQFTEFKTSEECHSDFPVITKGEVFQLFSAEEALECLMVGGLRSIACCKLYSVQIIAGIRFEKKKLIDDEFWTYKVLGNASRVVKISDVLYLYRQHVESTMGRSYNIRRLEALEAYKQRIAYIAERFPELQMLATKTFCSGSIFHYQMLLISWNIDPDKTHRKRIVKNMAGVIDTKFLSILSLKEKVWLRLFLFAPDMTCRVRNKFKIGF